MTKHYGIKDRDVAAAWVMQRLFDGRLRSGDRLDRQQIADEVGMSRVPVQEMLAQLERDGVVRSEYHRGAYIERFDADVVRETYDLFGLITGRASAAAAAVITPELAATLNDLFTAIRKADDNTEFNRLTWEFRRTVNLAASGPRMRALLSTFGTFMPTAYALILERSRSRILRHYRGEYTALIKGDAAGARRAAEGRCADEADLVVADLVRRGVFSEPATQIRGA